MIRGAGPWVALVAVALFPAGCPTGDDGDDDVTDDSGDDDSGDDDTGDDDDVTPATVILLNPTGSEALFVGTRYDLLAHVSGETTAALDAADATAECDELTAAGLLHCGFVPRSPGALTLTVTAGGAAAAVDVDVSEPGALIPTGDQFIVGMYEVYSEEAMAALAASHFNLVQTYPSLYYTTQEWQDWAAAAGLYTFADIDLGATTEETIAAIEELGAQPQVGWWDLPEEQRYWYADEMATVVDLSALCRAHDPGGRPVYMYIPGHYHADDIAHYVDHLDIIGTGTYVNYSGQPHAWVRWRMEENLAAIADAGYTTADRVPVSIPAIFRYEGAADPTPAEVRFDAFESLASGALGIVYFGWWYAENVLDPAVGEEVYRVGDLIGGEAGFGEAVLHGVAHGELDVVVLQGPEQGPEFTPIYYPTPVVYPAIHAVAWDHHGTRF
ncbi:MAG: hypothetical protein QGH45_01870, partial [Myxococcota bacterium]|nr:hypothetical protein [Myxococcota bacterium]